MSEAITAGTNALLTHPRGGMCKEMIELFVSQGIGAYCRFAHQGGGFNIERTTKEKLFSWNLTHGGYFRRFSTEFSVWRNRDCDALCRLLKSPEFFAEICIDNIRIFKHRDFSA